jgi:NAD(P)-dependent dehydrogenase (short-subunit alcohol dehydrogenase family)
MANAIVFISSPDACYIAGTEFEVDGGLSAN